MADGQSWTGTWTQKWVDQVTGRKFRNFSVPRTSLLQRLRSFSSTHGQKPEVERRGGNNDDNKRRQTKSVDTQTDRRASFDYMQFSPATIVDLRQYGITPGSMVVMKQDVPSYPQYISTDDDSTSTTTESSRDSDSSQSKSRKKRRRNCLRCFIGLFGFLAIVAVIAVAVYFKLAPSNADATQSVLSKYYAARMTARVTNEIFQEKWTNQQSAEFVSFQLKFCTAINSVYSNATSLRGYSGCSVDLLRNGSVMVDFSLFFVLVAAPSGAQLVTSLVQGATTVTPGTLTLPGDVRIELSKLVVTAVVEVAAADYLPKVIANAVSSTAAPFTSTTSSPVGGSNLTVSVAPGNSTTDLNNSSNATTPFHDANVTTTPFDTNATSTPFDANVTTTHFNANATTTPFNANATSTPFDVNATTTPFDVNATTTPFDANATSTPLEANVTTTPYDANSTSTPFDANATSTTLNANATTTPFDANATSTTPLNTTSSPINANATSTPINANATSTTPLNANATTPLNAKSTSTTVVTTTSSDANTSTTTARGLP